MCASHIPFVFVEFDNGEHKLIAHLARKNKQVEMLERVQKCLVVFQRVDSYISPAWYPVKKKTHKFVPTWDFAAVYVYVLPIFNQSSNSTKINHRLMLKAYVENLLKEFGGERGQEMARLVKDNYPGSL
ncbi:XXYS1_4_G0006860.mRNA.1.CDS.1 [Saccharomyces cerevisiae]|nr:EM14S01-3B_G0004000.mRNA.1.CDS.1 [Saccharomyces cerevisiae]CAD6634815.1 XXYS1_4_G0006860.mRNA.1.CDS.1 [Saccharomyces cerevisiae]CAI4596366.1 AMH_1a_G0032550.mRNA.1.CDS.1 [Saccharomyces cerevisiae]CAI4598387.1 CEI_1a_G0032400.mRNA.1.CDS.1 [Saccharomyces cerevisiae]CAI6767579.1 AMH_1a_G0032550.mRNA.1.CDS.1 [Saccharomyces cerevisiae]